MKTFSYKAKLNYLCLFEHEHMQLLLVKKPTGVNIVQERLPSSNVFSKIELTCLADYYYQEPQNTWAY